MSTRPRALLGLVGLAAAASVLASADPTPTRTDPDRDHDLTDEEVADAFAWMVDRALAAAGSDAS